MKQFILLVVNLSVVGCSSLGTQQDSKFFTKKQELIESCYQESALVKFIDYMQSLDKKTLIANKQRLLSYSETNQDPLASLKYALIASHLGESLKDLNSALEIFNEPFYKAHLAKVDYVILEIYKSQILAKISANKANFALNRQLKQEQQARQKLKEKIKKLSAIERSTDARERKDSNG